MPEVPVNSVINLNTPATVPDGFEDPQVRSAVDLFLQTFSNLLRNIEQYVGITQKDITLWDSLLPTDTLLRHQAGRLYVEASEAINNGHFINLHNDAGVLKCRKAQGTSGAVRPAHGFCSTSGGIIAGERGEVILSQGLLAISGVLPAQAIYLSTAAGQAGTAALTAAGQLEQFLGIGVALDLVYVDISLGPYIQH